MKHDKNDLLRRQDCIETIEGITSSMSVCVNTDECHGMKRMQRQAVLEIANMPAAQPEIVRCKDCKYNVSSHKCLHPESFFLVPDDDFYCGYAERRSDD